MAERNKLKMHSIARISLVDKGDNPSANIMIAKRAPVASVLDKAKQAVADLIAKVKALTFDEIRGESKAREELWRLTDDLHTAVRAAIESEATDEEKATALVTSVDQFATALKDVLPAMVGKVKTTQPKEDPVTCPDCKKEMPAGAAKCPHCGAVQKSQQKEPTVPDPTTTETVSKADFEALQKRAAAAELAAKENADRVEKLETQRETDLFITKAAALRGIPGLTADDFGPIYRKISKALTPEEFAKVEAMLKGAAAAGLKILGEIGTEENGDLSPVAQIDALVKQAIEKDPSLTPAKAEVQVYKQRPDLRAAIDTYTSKR